MRLKKLGFYLPLLALMLSPAAANAAKTRVLFLSNPPGTTVTDPALGELGVTPFELNLKRNTVLECTFSKFGFESRTISQTLEGLRVEIRADLPALPETTVRLGVEPRIASVKLTGAEGTEVYSGEGNRVHTLPNTLFGEGGTGSFHVEASASGYRPLEQAFTVAQHEHHDLSLTLEEVSTVLSVTSEPEGVRVSDRHLGLLGITPFEARVSLVELMRARSRGGARQKDAPRLLLTFSKSGYRTTVKQVEVDFDHAENAVEMELESVGDPE